MHQTSQASQQASQGKYDDANRTWIDTRQAHGLFVGTNANHIAAKHGAGQHNLADDDDDEEQFTAAMLAEAVENQLAAGKPPAAQASFNKLSLVGYAREEIIELMSQVLAYSIKQMLDSGQPFDMPGYERLLRELPTLPELTDEAAQ